MAGMSRTTTISAAAVLAIVVACAAATVAYDDAHDDTIARGVSVAGIDVGGLGTRAARARLDARLTRRLQRTLVVVAGDRRFTLSAREARLRADLDAMVSDALARGRRGGILARTWRALTGGDVKAQIAPDVRFSEAAVRRLVARVDRAVARRPVDAGVAIAGDRVVVRRSLPGLALEPGKLRADVRRALRTVPADTGTATSTRTTAIGTTTTAAAARLVRTHLVKTPPTVTTARLAHRYPTILAVDRSRFRISLFKHLRRVQTYPIAVGQVGLETPAGRYRIRNKAVDPAWHVPNSPWAGSLAGQVIPGGAPDNPIKARWLGVYDGVGVHGTSDRASIGSNASHGCIRMLVEDVEKLYDEVPVGTPIFIA